ncbi:MAG: sulfatase-like hydrolase/transferase [Flavobacteriaceae bacterium]
MNTTKNYIFLYSVLFCLGSCKDLPKANVNSGKETIGEKPNIILVMTDDLGWFDVGFNGNREVKTPNIDDMASQGIIFNRFYSASPVCSPTRASFITGRNPLRMNIPNANSGHMKEEEITLPEILKNHGYINGHFGKWHLGTLTKKTYDANRGGRKKFEKDYSVPTDHGYDFYFSTESKVPTYDPMIKPKSFEVGESLRYGWKKVKKSKEEPYGTAYWIGDETIDTTEIKGDDSKVIMDRVIRFAKTAVNKKHPFFTTIWFHTPHLPVVADSLARSEYKQLGLKKQLYYGSITGMDTQMGRLWQMLENLGVQENTIVLFCSDNGPENGTPGSAGLFRGRKRSLYEGGVRVPAFMVWKDKLSVRKVNVAMTTSDILPTVLDMLAIEYPAKRPLDGISILPFISQEFKERKSPIGFIYLNKISWVSERYKLISTDKGETFELYDLIEDVGEEKNIIEKMPELAETMKGQLDLWLISVMASKNGKDY